MIIHGTAKQPLVPAPLLLAPPARKSVYVPPVRMAGTDEPTESRGLGPFALGCAVGGAVVGALFVLLGLLLRPAFTPIAPMYVPAPPVTESAPAPVPVKPFVAPVALAPQTIVIAPDATARLPMVDLVKHRPVATPHASAPAVPLRKIAAAPKVEAPAPAAPTAKAAPSAPAPAPAARPFADSVVLYTGGDGADSAAPEAPAPAAKPASAPQVVSIMSDSLVLIAMRVDGKTMVSPYRVGQELPGGSTIQAISKEKNVVITDAGALKPAGVKVQSAGGSGG